MVNSSVLYIKDTKGILVYMNTKTLAEILKEGRLHKGLSQYDVAQRLGFKSMDRISRWESGKARPSIENLNKLINLYEISIENILNLL